MTTPYRTLQMALDALEDSLLSDGHRNYELQAKAIATLCSALEAPEPEPVAYLVEGWHDGKLIAHIPRLTLEDAKASAAVFSQHYTTTKLVPLYAAPPAAPAPAAPVVPLTDGQIRQIVRDTFDVVPLSNDITFARAIEAAHGITGDKP